MDGSRCADDGLWVGWMNAEIDGGKGGTSSGLRALRVGYPCLALATKVRLDDRAIFTFPFFTKFCVTS